MAPVLPKMVSPAVLPVTNQRELDRADESALPEAPVAEPINLSPSMLRQALQNIETEFSVNKADLLGNLYLETRRTPMGRVIFEKYKSSDLTIDPHAMQRLCYEFGVYFSAKDVEDSVRRIASLPGGTMIYQDFMIWWLQNEAIRSVHEYLLFLNLARDVLKPI